MRSKKEIKDEIKKLKKELEKLDRENVIKPTDKVFKAKIDDILPVFRSKMDRDTYKKIVLKIAKLSKDWRPDWYDKDQEKYYFNIIEQREVKLVKSHHNVRHQGTTYMPKDVAVELMESLTDMELHVWLIGGDQHL